MIHISHRILVGMTLSLISLFSSTALVAQADADALRDYLPSGCHHSGQYLQHKTLTGLAHPLVTQGMFIYACDHGLVWHTAAPITETAIYKISGQHYLLSESDELVPMKGRVHQSLGTLLNHLIGGDSAYLERHFHAAAETDHLRLTPKNKRLKKFIQYISIHPQGDKVAIELQHAAGESTYITISDRQIHTSLTQDLCAQLLPSKSLACDTLLAE